MLPSSLTRSRARVALTAAAAASALALTGCGGSDSGADATSGSSASSSAGAESKVDPSLEAITVTQGSDTKAPSITLKDKPLTATETQKKVLEEGSGEAVPDDGLVAVDLAMFSGKDGKLIPNSETFTAEPTLLDLGNEQMLPGLSKAIRGAKVGGRGVATIPPKDLFGEAGQPELGIAGDDTLVLVYDLRELIPSEAKGSEVAPKKGLPKVTWKADAPASFAMPKTDPPSKLVVQPLISGEGEKVKKGDTVYVTYTGALWKNGKVFDTSQQEGRGPFTFTVGQSQVIKGWDEGLVGQPVGSRVLLVVPPKEGYGSQGSPDGTITAKDTIVFVVDILAAR